MARKASVGLIIFGVVNILVALAPPCAGVVGASYFLSDPVLPVKGRNLGPQFKQHLDRELPAAKFEAFGAVACNCFVSLLLLAGAIGLFFAQTWARWLSVAAGILMLLTFCIHDVYQLAVFRPSLMTFFDQHLPPGPEREGFKIGFSGTFFLWSCINPLLMIYLAAMSLSLALSGAFSDTPPAKRRRGDFDDRDESAVDDD